MTVHARTEIERALLAEKVIAILRGVRFIEFTLEAEGGLATLETMHASAPPDVLVGAGSITTAAQAWDALAAGAAYLVSPGLFAEVSDVANARDVLYIPGVLTATEVGLALRRGHTILKLFPAGLMGTDYLRALQAPYPAARFPAVGNIGVSDVAAFLGAGAAGVAMGSQLAGRGDDPESIAEKARAVVARIREFASA